MPDDEEIYEDAPSPVDLANEARIAGAKDIGWGVGMATRTIVISIELDISSYEDKCALSDGEFAAAIYNHVLPERNELATEARIAGLTLMDGEKLGPRE